MWWLPDNPELKLRGTLTYFPNDRVFLDLEGIFKEKYLLFNPCLNPEIILGVSGSKNITLYQTFETSSGIRDNCIYSTFSIQYVLIGKHFENQQDIKFSSMAANYTYLEEWLVHNPFETAFAFESDHPIPGSGKETFKEITVKYAKQAKQEVKLPYLNSTISIVHMFQYKEELPKDIYLKHSSSISITSYQEKEFEWYQNVHKDLENFFTLVIGYPVYPRVLKGYGENIKISDNDTIKEEIDIFYPLLKPNIKRRLHSSDMIITFPDIKDNLEEYLNNWFIQAEILRPVYDLVFGTFYNPSMYREFHFLALTQAIETFHRRIYEGKYLPEPGYQPVKGTLIDAIPKYLKNDFRERLKQLLDFGNEYTLRMRLKELLNIYWDRGLENFVEDKSSFINYIVNTRNYLTHYNKELKDKSARGEELYNLNERLLLLLIILLLEQLGIPRHNIYEILTKRGRFSHLKLKN